MGPSFVGLTNLSYSLGITPLFLDQYSYENSGIPSHINPILSNNDSISLFNIFLLVILTPLIVALIFKVVAGNKGSDKDHQVMDKVWKYSLASYTYYGLLLLAYGELASLLLNLRHFSIGT